MAYKRCRRAVPCRLCCLGRLGCPGWQWGDLGEGWCFFHRRAHWPVCGIRQPLPGATAWSPRVTTILMHLNGSVCPCRGDAEGRSLRPNASFLSPFAPPCHGRSTATAWAPGGSGNFAQRANAHTDEATECPSQEWWGGGWYRSEDAAPRRSRADAATPATSLRGQSQFPSRDPRRETLRWGTGVAGPPPLLGGGLQRPARPSAAGLSSSAIDWQRGLPALHQPRTHRRVQVCPPPVP